MDLDIDSVFDAPQEAAPETVVEQVAQPESQPVEQPQPTEPSPPPAPVEPTYTQAQLAEIMRGQREDYQQREQRLTQQLQQQYQPQQPPVVPPETWEEGYAEYVHQQTVAQVQPHIAQLQNQMAQMQYQHSLELARTANGAEWDKLYGAANQLVQEQPAYLAVVQGSSNPGLEITRLGKMALALTQPALAPTGITEEVRQQVLREEAAKRASAGQPPQSVGPRGVGAATAGTGNSDYLPAMGDWSQVAAKDPAKWDQIKNSVFGA